VLQPRVLLAGVDLRVLVSLVQLVGRQAEPEDLICVRISQQRGAAGPSLLWCAQHGRAPGSASPPVSWFTANEAKRNCMRVTASSRSEKSAAVVVAPVRSPQGWMESVKD
jgi:hypothetical protein